MIFDAVVIFLALLGGVALSAVAVFYGLKISDAVRAHLWAREQAKKPAATIPSPRQVYLSLGGRLEARSRESQAIHDAREDSRRKMERATGMRFRRAEDYDIETITRQIEEQN